MPPEDDGGPLSPAVRHRQSFSEPDSDSEMDFEVGESEGGDVRLALLSKPLPSTHKRVLSNSLRREKESTASLVKGILKEAAPTLFATVIGMVVTGELLVRISTWRVMRVLDELFIMIPMLTNMKGNLEMNLSARLSTAANTGELDNALTRQSLIFGNLSLLQIQAIIMSTLAALFSFALGKILPSPEEGVVPLSANSTTIARGLAPVTFPLTWRSVTRPTKLPLQKSRSGAKEFFNVLSIAFASASASALILGSFMCTVVILCRRFDLNPDNISPPLASCLGDLITLALLGFMATVITLPAFSWLPISALIIVFVIVTLIASAYTTLRNTISRQHISQGWTPLVCAMVVSSGAGLVLDRFVTRWEGYGALAIVISGLPGSIGSIFVSRLSTDLHAGPAMIAHPSGKKYIITSMTLGFVGLPVLFSYLAFMCGAGWLDVPGVFLTVYVVVFCFSTALSLGLAYFLTQFLWARNLDPDCYCLPIHSSLIDLAGQCLLVVAYLVSSGLGADVKLKLPS
ncbi:Mg transporter [Cantharellus anzutake]|uniref:Mg transporter n=1 Tax=Cantharellus anzutake TaxID=1750568 RepID=UPI001905D1E7|nr:Mg transporter [Cantharellus anzutake]KAF8344133.1 Mg transporter [Cantharellus anzutake]